MNARKARVLLVTGFVLFLAVMFVVTYEASHHHQWLALAGCYALNITVGIVVGRTYANLR